MTMRELMSHTAGFDVSGGYAKLNIPDRTQPLQAMIDKLAKLPLRGAARHRLALRTERRHPGLRRREAVRADARRVPQHAHLRAAQDEGHRLLGRCGESGPRDHASTPTATDKKIITAPTQGDPTRKPVFLSGSGGLLSTTEDYFRFAQMLLNGGELDGARILKPTTVELMRTNVLADGVKVDLYGPNSAQEGIGFGLDFAIVMDPRRRTSPRRPELVLLGRRVRHLVLDRSHQRSDRRRHDSEPGWQPARSRVTASAAAIEKAGLRGARRSTEVGQKPKSVLV